ncbi:MAG: DHA2 family efflux MFS transporter permease subunit [Gammaproteobacteria bacterium]
MASGSAEQGPAPLQGGLLAVTSIALALGTFMQVLDTTIANVSLPTIAGNLGATTDQGTWIITSFAVSNGVAVPLTGWLMQRYGAVRTFVASIFLFTVASFLCGIAWSLPSLVVFRVLQGAVSGPLIPGSQALLISIFPRDKRTTALGIWSITTLVAPISGPILGGYISDNYHWSWIFLINVPVGILAGVLCWNGLSNRETPTRKLPIDSVGLGLLVVWVGALQFVLDTGKNADWFASTQIVIFTIIAVVGFIAWIIWELTDEHPAVDLSLFKERNFALGTLAFCLGYAVFFANLLILPLWLQTNLGYTATWAGLVAAPSGVVAVMLTPIATRYMSRSDTRWFASLALVAFGLSYYLRARLTADASFWDFVLPMLVQGIGMTTFFVSLVAISLDGIKPERIPSATGIANFSRITAGGFAASLTTTLWDRRETLHQSRLTDTISALDPAMQHATGTLHQFGFTDPQSYALILRTLVNQAYLLASLDFFWLSTWLTVAMIGVIWLTRRSTGSGARVALD